MKLVPFAAILFFSSLVSAQATFEKRFQPGVFGINQKIIKTHDNDYAILGTITSNVSVIKLDSNYNQVWSNKINIYPNIVSGIYVSGVIETNDNGFVILGYSNPIDYLLKRTVFIIKLNQSGNKEWAKDFYDPGLAPTGLIEMKNKSLVVAGTTYYKDTACILLLNFDQNGKLLSNKFYKGPDHLTVENITAEDGNNFTIVGLFTERLSTYSYNRYPYMAGFDKNSNVLWSKAISIITNNKGNPSVYPKSLIKTSDGGYATIMSALGVTKASGYIIKTSNTGKFEWSKKMYTENDYYTLTDLAATADGGFIITGNNNSANIFVSKTNNKGETEWSKKFTTTTGFYYSTARSIVQTKDEGFLIAGDDALYVNGSSNPNAALFKIDNAGNSCGISTEAIKNTSVTANSVRIHIDSLPHLNVIVSDLSPIYNNELIPYDTYCYKDYYAKSNLSSNIKQFQNNSEIALYPNPAKDYLKIKVITDKNDLDIVQIITINGAVISSEKKFLNAGVNEMHLNVGSLNPGNYFVKIISGNKFEILKFVKQ